MRKCSRNLKRIVRQYRQAQLSKSEVNKIDVLVDAFRKKNYVPGLSISVVRNGAKI